MSYSTEQVEQKRLLALKRKEQAQNSKASYCGKAGSSGASEFKGNKEKARFNPCKKENFYKHKSLITAKCIIITNSRFMLETSAYFPPAIEVLKTVSSRSYDFKNKTWNFDLKDYEIVVEKLMNFKTDLQIVGIPKKVLQTFRNSTSDIDRSIDLSSIDPMLVENLMPFQREGVCYGISKGARCMIADDMGLGKTIQALGIAHYFKKNWPLLIVAPSSVRYQWAEAIYRFLPTVPAHYVYDFTSTKDFIDDCQIVITSYDLLVRAVDTFEHRAFGFVILDESHALKSVKTARLKAAQRVVKHACHVVLLTGTPALSRPIELYSQVKLIMPDFLGYQDFGIRYCAGKKTVYGWDFTGSSNMQELHLLLKHTCVIRRLKKDVLKQLTAKNREVIILDSDLIKVGTQQMLEMSKKLEKNVLTGAERHNALLQYFNETSVAKQKAVCHYISKLFEENRKCIIFGHHRSILDAICEVAESKNIRYIRIDGKTNPENRKWQVDKFQTSDDYRAAILSITAANAGITLTAAQLVVFAELFWNPGILCQAEDRVHRIGQQDNVIIRYLVAKQTADDYLWPLIKKKMSVLNEVGLEQDFSLNDINEKHALDAKQPTLDCFAYSSKKCSTLDTGSSSAIEELQSTTEDLNFSDWDGKFIFLLYALVTLQKMYEQDLKDQRALSF